MQMPIEIKGQGAPLVLLGGGLTGWASWGPIAERLAVSRTVVRIQLLGVQLGLEDEALPEDYSPALEVRALGAALDASELVPPIDFAGWSYGGRVALEYALERPEWARTLTLIEPDAAWAVDPDDEAVRREREHDLAMPTDYVSEEDLESFLRNVALVPPDKDPRELAQWPTWVQHRQSLRTLPHRWDDLSRPRELEVLDAPVLLVKGTGSTPLLHRMLDELARRLPDASVRELPGGHAPHLVSTEPFLEAMAAFHHEAGAGSARS